MREASIIGGGIGGLCTAVALQQRGYTVQVYEQTARLKPVGAGITLGVNAMRVLQTLGLAAKVIQHGNVLEHIGIKTDSDQVLNQLQPAASTRDDAPPPVAIHRADLHQILRQNLLPDSLNLGQKLQHYHQNPETVSATFDSGTRISTSLLIGSDGINSQVRRLMYGDSPLRDARQVCWRGICNGSVIRWPRASFFEFWGRGCRFGFVFINADQIYWFLTINRKEVTEPETNQLKPYLQQRFRSWPAPIPEILAGTAPEAIIRNDLYDRRPVRGWYTRRVVLLGDAIHSTTPNLGQGAGMAIESAAVLAHALENKPDLASALNCYETLRAPRTRRVTQQSWQLGQIATLSHPLAATLRNQLLQAVPSSWMAAQSTWLFNHNIYTT